MRAKPKVTETHGFDVDFDAILELRKLTPASIFGELIDLYLTDSRRRLSDIKGAMEKGDLDALSEAAHGLKGSSLSLGVSSVAEVSGQLEHAARGGEKEDIDEIVSKVEQRFLGVIQVLEEIKDEHGARAPRPSQSEIKNSKS